MNEIIDFNPLYIEAVLTYMSTINTKNENFNPLYIEAYFAEALGEAVKNKFQSSLH